MDDLIQQGANALKSGDRETARKLLVAAVNDYCPITSALGVGCITSVILTKSAYNVSNKCYVLIPQNDKAVALLID